MGRGQPNIGGGAPAYGGPGYGGAPASSRRQLSPGKGGQPMASSRRQMNSPMPGGQMGMPGPWGGSYPAAPPTGVQFPGSAGDSSVAANNSMSANKGALKGALAESAERIRNGPNNVPNAGVPGKGGQPQAQPWAQPDYGPALPPWAQQAMRQRQLASEPRQVRNQNLTMADRQPEPGPWYGEGREDSPFNDAFAAHRKRINQGWEDPGSYRSHEYRPPPTRESALFRAEPPSRESFARWQARGGPVEEQGGYGGPVSGGKGGQVQAPADRMQRQLDSDLSHEAAFSKSPLFKHIAGRGGQGGAPVVPESQGTYDGPVSGGNMGKMDQLGRDISSFQRPHSGYQRYNPGVGGGMGRMGPPPRGGRRGGGKRRQERKWE